MAESEKQPERISGVNHSKAHFFSMAYEIGDKEKHNLFKFENNLKEASDFKKKVVWSKNSEIACLLFLHCELSEGEVHFKSRPV